MANILRISVLVDFGLTALDKSVSLEKMLAKCHEYFGVMERFAAYLQGIFSGEALAAKRTREGLDCQVDSLVTLQVVISAERLNTLVTFEGTFRLGLRLSV